MTFCTPNSSAIILLYQLPNSRGLERSLHSLVPPSLNDNLEWSIKRPKIPVAKKSSHGILYPWKPRVSFLFCLYPIDLGIELCGEFINRIKKCNEVSVMVPHNTGPTWSFNRLSEERAHLNVQSFCYLCLGSSRQNDPKCWLSSSRESLYLQQGHWTFSFFQNKVNVADTKYRLCVSWEMIQE